jgi:hypothetical protein
MEFVPYHELGDLPNIVVDGGPAASTKLVLSHWPRSGTPAALKADLSAQIVFKYLTHPEWRIDVPAVSNNHFDEDGLVSLFSILHPEQALKQRKLLIEIASAGDFGTYQDRLAVRTYFTIAAFADEQKSPLDQKIFEGPYPQTSAALYTEMLDRLPHILEQPQDYEVYWRNSDEDLRKSEDAIAQRLIKVEEVPDIDLAVFTAPEGFEIHPVAISNATPCFRVLTVIGGQYRFWYRYETWVQYISRRPIPRADLHPLAATLSEMEGSKWTFDGVDSIVPAMHKSDGAESRIPRDVFVSKLTNFLRTAPPAWNPYD